MLLPARCDLPVITGQDMLKVAVIGSGLMVDLDVHGWRVWTLTLFLPLLMQLRVISAGVGLMGEMLLPFAA
ncbi:hypothetical protein Nepgr_031343 [Nepenthes gracilis]|uniref:Uncharacterized protein n=1 Tax=Nepenthes gracilis TaxID=150966 RepID=A0AAD3TH73_NEPGR|nr:hypothetical protein Nepgr_031343 [Nepenthes gracilis]